MKRIIVIFIVLFGFTVSVFALSFNECKTDIYFGNGVWNSSEDAQASVDILNEVIDREIIKGDPALQAKYGEVKLQYNWGRGAMQDVLETYYQLKNEGQVNDLEFFALMMLLTSGNVPLSASATEALREAMPYVAEVEQANVDEMLAKYYNESFQYSHRVLLVSHSQGNLFANRVYDSIDPAGYKEYFANVQVASPASRVHANKGDYVTGYVDPIINPIPGSMESNAVLDLPGGHAFVAAYLDSQDTYERIVRAIKNQLEVLDNTPSQWNVDQEFDKGSCDYRITVKHRFDPSLEIGEKIYPFAPNQKLYAATNEKSGATEYVKATCGGTTFTDDWADKKDDECWMIDNDPKEKIISMKNLLKLKINTTLIIKSTSVAWTRNERWVTFGSYYKSYSTDFSGYHEMEELVFEPSPDINKKIHIRAKENYTILLAMARERLEKYYQSVLLKYNSYNAKRNYIIKSPNCIDGSYRTECEGAITQEILLY